MPEPVNEARPREVERALQTIRQADMAAGASPDLELQLRAAFQQHHRNGTANRRRRHWRWIAAPIAASIAGIAAWRSLPQTPLPRPSPVESAAVSPAPTKVGESVSPPAAKLYTSTKRPAKRKAIPVADSVPETTSAFIELPFAPALTPFEGGQVVRVRLPRSSMRLVGIPVNEDRPDERIPADILMGNDGIARAVRFLPGRLQD